MQVIHFASAQDWRNWLQVHHATEAEVWVGFYKKSSGKTGLSYDESVEQALCFGWIDGLTKRVDEVSYKIRFTPRKPKGNWAASNIKRVTKLIASGEMTEAGLKHVEAAKKDGRWKI